MKLYLDASVLVALLIRDALSNRAFMLMERLETQVLVSDFAAVEFASAISRRVRMAELTEQDAHAAFMGFDAWTARAAERIETMPADMKAAKAMLRRSDTKLCTGDALNIAIADRLGAALATFDRKMAEAARALGVTVVGEEAVG